MTDEYLDIEDEQEDEESLEKKIAPQLYDLRVSKGKVGDVPINIWDHVRDCRGPKCKLYAKCPYFQLKSQREIIEKKIKNDKAPGLCKVEQRYLRQNLNPFLKLIQKVPDEFVVQIIGMHIIPLYSDLVQLKMEKAALEEISYEDAKGTIRIHPVYDQLAKTHKEIMNVWKTSKLQNVAEAVGFFHSKEGYIENSGDDFLNGDPDSYDEMSSGKV